MADKFNHYILMLNAVTYAYIVFKFSRRRGGARAYKYSRVFPGDLRSYGGRRAL